MAYLDFYRDKYAVAVSELPGFLAWAAAGAGSGMAKARRLASLLLNWAPARVLPGDLPRAVIAQLGDFSWVRYSSDGGRVQSFCAVNHTVRKISLNPVPGSIETEIGARRRMGGYTPEILRADAAAGLIEERWVRVLPAGYSLLTLARAMRLLKENLYSVSVIPAVDYVSRFDFLPEKEGLLRFMEAAGLLELRTTPAHGDLWQNNVAVAPGGGLLLFDWEYAGDYAVTYDVWMYLFQARVSRALPRNGEFFELFAEQAAEIYGGPIDGRLARALHVLHLLERYRMMRATGLAHKRAELRMLREEVDSIFPVVWEKP